MDQKTLKQLEQLIKSALINVATKDDLSHFVTKVDLQNFATKDDLSRFATKNDLERFATKDDLMVMKTELIKEIRDVEVSVTVSADKNKAERADLEKLTRRVDKIEQKLIH